MSDFLGESLVHGLLAAGFIGALLFVWRIRAPVWRLRFRLLGLCAPLLLTPFLFLAFPIRRVGPFRDRWALFDTFSWRTLRIGAARADVALAALLGALGLGLFLRDTAPALFARLRQRRLPCQGASEAQERLTGEVGRLALRAGATIPSICLLETEEALVFCTGLRRPVLVVSRGTLDRLDPEELEAALSHELAHLVRRDTLLGWALVGARALLAFNPAAQLLGRAAIQEMEGRADDDARAGSGGATSLASAFLKLGAVRQAALAARRRRLLRETPPPDPPLPVLRLVLSGAALAALLFFVV